MLRFKKSVTLTCNREPFGSIKTGGKSPLKLFHQAKEWKRRDGRRGELTRKTVSCKAQIWMYKVIGPWGIFHLILVEENIII